MSKPYGRAVELIEILHALPENDWAWSILDLWAIGTAPDGMAMPAFEESLSSSETGHRLTWPGLLSLAADFEQVMDCLIVATKTPHASPSQLVEQHSAPELLVTIEGLDSGQWHIRVNQHLDDVKKIEERLTLLGVAGS